jgi:hypothetical protein
MLLFHSNLNKWTLNTPTRWEGYERRWQVITPDGWRFSSHHAEDPPLADLREGRRVGLRYDPERVAWTFLTSLHCSDWLEGYLLGVGNPGQIERVFDTHRRPYNSFLLDEHMTGQFEHVSRVGEHASGLADAAGQAGGGPDGVQAEDLGAALEVANAALTGGS